MVKTKKIFFHPVKRQIFDDAPKQTFYMISKLVLCRAREEELMGVPQRQIWAKVDKEQERTRR